MSGSSGPDGRVGPSQPLATDPVVVLVGTDAAALGAVARELEASGRRAAVFVGDVTAPEGRAALHEMLDELFASG